jgi:putative tryptophan/tyrosine transport system substrate-binding protein
MSSRREFIMLLCDAATAWPFAARAAGPRPRIAVLSINSEQDERKTIAAFVDGLRALGYVTSQNVDIDYRYAEGDTTRDRLARPGGNVTGFTPFEYGISTKWLELLKEIAPGVTRVAVLRDAAVPEVGQLATIQAVARSLGVDVSPIGARDAGEIEHAIAAFARSSNGGLVVPGSALAAVHRDRIAALAAQNKLPAVYYNRMFITAGGLISYGPEFLDQFRRAATYIDRILKGEKPADLPVQAPTKYELVINLKTAKALGLEVPPTLLARADEVIE